MSEIYLGVQIRIMIQDNVFQVLIPLLLLHFAGWVIHHVLILTGVMGLRIAN